MVVLHVLMGEVLGQLVPSPVGAQSCDDGCYKLINDCTPFDGGLYYLHDNVGFLFDIRLLSCPAGK